MKSLYILILSYSLNAYPAWSPPIDLSQSGFAQDPQIAIDNNGNATAVWSVSGVIQSSTKLFGSDWQALPDNVSQVGDNASLPQIAVDGSGNATAVWIKAIGISPRIVQASTKPFGGSWQMVPDNLTLAGLAFDPQIVVDSAGNATAIWSGNSTILASTKPFGGSWQAVPDTLSAAGATTPQIAVDSNGNLTAVWVAFDGSNNIIQASTKPFGGSWQLVPDDLSATGQNGDSPQIAVDNAGNATAVWSRSDGSNLIVQAATKPFGGSWQLVPDNLSAPGQDAVSPQIAVDSSGNITAVWSRSDGTNFIIQSSTKPFGGTWQATPDNVSTAGQDSSNPQIAIDTSGNAIVVWLTASGGFDFIVQASTKPFGGSWQTVPDTLSDVGASGAQIASNGGATIAIWSLFDGGSSIVQASELQNALPSPVTNFVGSVIKNKFLNFTQCVLAAAWDPSASPNIDHYIILKNGMIVQTIATTAPFLFTDSASCIQQPDTFTIIAVDTNGIESTPTTLVIVS